MNKGGGVLFAIAGALFLHGSLATSAADDSSRVADRDALPAQVRTVLKPTFEEYIRRAAAPKEFLDRWLAGPSWVVFDPELGYVLSNSIMPWGEGKTATLETVQANGARTSWMFANKVPRINTYGDSFTECNQVNDGETWQEYLAGHIGEPVANFGVGGYGVYQAYRRMLREEATDHGAEYLILTICCDDSTRSLFRYRRAVFFDRWSEYGGKAFHGNFWSNLEMDLKSGKFVEHEQLLKTKESLYRMTQPDWMVENLRDDLALQLSLYSRGVIRDLDKKRVSKLASHLDFDFNWSLDSGAGDASVQSGKDASLRTAMQTQVAALLNRYSQRATIYILGRAKEFAASKNKKLLVVLTLNANLDDIRDKSTREDQELVDYLKRERISHVDMNEILVRRFAAPRPDISARESIGPLLVDGMGHFNPSGNHLMAYSIKDELVRLLDPKPVIYRSVQGDEIDFSNYLRGGSYR